MTEETQSSGELAGDAPSDEPPSTSPAAATATDSASSSSEDAANIDSLLNQAQEALAGIDEPLQPLPPGVTAFEFKNLAGSGAVNDAAPLDLLRDVHLDLKIELGRTHMHLDEVLDHLATLKPAKAG